MSSFFGTRTSNTGTYFNGGSSSYGKQTTKLYKGYYAENKREDSFALITGKDTAKVSDGSFGFKYESRSSNLSESKNFKLHSILGMSEYAEFDSHLMMRIMDYNRIRTGNLPENQQLVTGIAKLLKDGCMDESIFDKQVLQKLQNIDRGGYSSDRGGTGGFFSNNSAGGSSGGFFSGTSNNSTRESGGSGGFFSSKGQSNSGSVGGFFSNTGDSNRSTTGSTGGGFFSNNSSTGSRGGGFFSNNSGGTGNTSTGGGFFSSNSNNEEGRNGGGGFFSNNSNGNSSRSSGGFFSNNSSNTTGNGNSGSGGFFTNNLNQNSNSGGGGGFFSNNSSSTSRGGFFFNNSGGNNNSGGGFFSNNRSNGNNNNGGSQGGFFSNQNSNQRGGFFSGGQSNQNYSQGQGVSYQIDPIQQFILQQLLQNQQMMIQQSGLLGTQSEKKSSTSSFALGINSSNKSSPFDYEREAKERLIRERESLTQDWFLKKKFDAYANLIHDDVPTANASSRMYDNIAQNSGTGRKSGLARLKKKPISYLRTNNKMSKNSKLTLSRSNINHLSQRSISDENSIFLKAHEMSVFEDPKYSLSRLKQEMNDMRNRNYYIKCVAQVEFLDHSLEIEFKANKDLTLFDLQEIIVLKCPRFGHSEVDFKDAAKLIINNKIYEDDLLVGEVCKDGRTPIIVLQVELHTGKSSELKSILSSAKKSKISPFNKSLKFEHQGYDCENESESFEDVSRLDAQGSSFSPVLSKCTYYTTPSISTLKKMSELELAKVRDFEIGNQFGKVYFPGETDLRGINLDITVIIKKNVAEVYPDDSFDEITKPPVGTKLNKTAIISLFDIDVQSSEPTHRIIDRLRKMARSQDADFISFDPETRDYKFKVYHFTKYGFDQMGFDSDEESPQKDNQMIDSIPHRNINYDESSEKKDFGRMFRNLNSEEIKKPSKSSKTNKGEFGSFDGPTTKQPFFDSLIQQQCEIDTETFEMEEETPIETFIKKYRNLASIVDSVQFDEEFEEEQDFGFEFDLPELSTINDIIMCNKPLQMKENNNFQDTISSFTFDWSSAEGITFVNHRGQIEEVKIEQEDLGEIEERLAKEFNIFGSSLISYKNNFLKKNPQGGEVRLKDSLEVIKIAHYLASKEMELDDQQNKMQLFCALFGIPRLNLQQLEGLNFEEVCSKVEAKKNYKESLSLEEDRKRALLTWLGEFFEFKFDEDLSRVRKTENNIRDSMLCNSVVLTSDELANEDSIYLSMSIISGYTAEQNVNMYRQVPSRVQKAIDLLIGNDKYARESLIGNFARKLTDNKDNSSISDLFLQYETEEIDRLKNNSDDDLAFFSLLRLYTEISTNKPISDFVDALKQETWVAIPHIWIISQFVLSLPDIGMNRKITQQIIFLEQTIVTKFLGKRSVEKAILFLAMSNSKIDRRSTLVYFIKSIIESTGELQRIEQDGVSGLPSLYPEFSRDQIADIKHAILRSEFRIDEAIEALDGTLITDEVFMLCNTLKKYSLLQRDNSDAIREFKTILSSIPLNQVINAEGRLIRSIIELEDAVSGQNPQAASSKLLEILNVLGTLSWKTKADVFQTPSNPRDSSWRHF